MNSPKTVSLEDQIEELTRYLRNESLMQHYIGTHGILIMRAILATLTALRDRTQDDFR